MASNQEINELFDAIKNILENKYPTFKIYEYEDIILDSSEPAIDTPAILIEIDDDFENDTEHNEQDSTRLTYRIRAYVCMSSFTDKVRLTIKQFTANLAHFVNNNTFIADPALLINGNKPVDIDIDGLEIRSIEWEQIVEITGDGTSDG